MMSSPIIRKIIYSIVLYSLLAAGVAIATLFLRKLLEFIPPLLQNNHDLYGWFSSVPIFLCLISGYYIYYAIRTVLYDYPNVKSFNLRHILVIFFVGFSIVLGVQSLVFAISWLKLAFGS